MEIPDSLKTPALREPVRRLHILVMSDGGGTRRFSVSTSFLWLLCALGILILGALALLSYMTSSLIVDNRNLKTSFEFEVRSLEAQAYNRSIPSTPEAAARLLERLDQAALSAGEDEDASDLPDVVPEARPGGPAEGTGVADAGDVADPVAGDVAADASGQAGTAPGDAGAGAQAAGGDGAPAAEDGNGGADAPAAGDAGDEADPSAAPAGPEEEVWAALHARLPLPEGEPILDVDEFRFSPDGSYTYYLKQAAEPGERLRGRAVTVFALADRDGKVRLVSDPEMDLRSPALGWDVGGRYNIIASKVYKGRVRIPQGGKALSAEVLAWDEETKGLIFLKRVTLEGGA